MRPTPGVFSVAAASFERAIASAAMPPQVVTMLPLSLMVDSISVLLTVTLSPEGGPAARLLAGRLQHKANNMIPPCLFMVTLGFLMWASADCGEWSLARWRVS